MSGGIAAATAATRTPNTTTTTTVTAAQRGRLRFTSSDTAGSSPRAKNIAAPTNTSTADAEPRTRTHTSPRRPLRALLRDRTENLDRIAHRVPRKADPLIGVVPQCVGRRESPRRRRRAVEPRGGDGPVRRGRDRPAQR